MRGFLRGFGILPGGLLHKELIYRDIVTQHKLNLRPLRAALIASPKALKSYRGTGLFAIFIHPIIFVNSFLEKTKKRKEMNEPPPESGGEEKIECFGNPVFLWAVTFREYSERKRGGNRCCVKTFGCCQTKFIRCFRLDNEKLSGFFAECLE